MINIAYGVWLWLQVGLVLGRELSVGIQDLRVDLSGRIDIDVDRPRVAVGDSSAPKRTIMQCLGTVTLTRACHFENVYYDLSSERFVHYGIAGARQEVFGDDNPETSDNPWLRLIRYAKYKSE